MFDFIRIFCKSDFSVDTLARRHHAGVTHYESGEERCFFKVDHLKCRANYDPESGCTILRIEGSGHRHYTRRSYDDFPVSSIAPALKKMCANCGANIDGENWITYIEIGVNLKMNNDPDDYFSMFKMYNGQPFTVMRTLDAENRPHGIELKLSNKYFKIKIYNKTLYARDVEKLSPPDNILRVEVAFYSAAIRKMGLPHNLDGLMDREQFRMYVDKFKEIIRGIRKADYTPDTSKLKGLILRDYFFMHPAADAYARYLERIKGDKKRLRAERVKYERLDELLNDAPSLKKEFTEKFEAKIACLLKPRRPKPKERTIPYKDTISSIRPKRLRAEKKVSISDVR